MANNEKQPVDFEALLSTVDAAFPNWVQNPR